MTDLTELGAAGLLPKEVDELLAERIVCDGCGREMGAVGDVHECRWIEGDRFPEMCGRGVVTDIRSVDDVRSAFNALAAVALEQAKENKRLNKDITFLRERNLIEQRAIAAANERADAWQQQRDAEHEAWAEAVERADKAEAMLRGAGLLSEYRVPPEPYSSARRTQSHATEGET